MNEYSLKRTNVEIRIFDALIDLMKSKNICEITVLELTKKANISRSTFYRLFENTNDVIKNVSDDLLEGIRDICRYYISSKLDLLESKNVDTTILALFRYIYKNRKIYTVLTSSNGDPQFRYKHEKIVKEFFGGRLAYNGINKEYPDIYMLFLLAGHSASIEYWLTNRPDISPEKMAIMIQRMAYGIYK